MNHYRELLVWRKAVDFAVRIYKETERFPKTEVYGITSQLRRASASIAANIAEGAGRNSDKEFVHFLSISLGSIYEVETFLCIAKEIEYLAEKNYSDLLLATDELNKMLRALQKSKNT
jgi:four helix bundle protein